MQKNNLTVLEQKLFNILINISYQPDKFHECIKSILAQTYKKYRIIVSYSDERCEQFLTEYELNENIYIYKSYQDYTQCQNIYINEILSKVNEGWIIILNENDIFTHNMVFRQLIYNMKNNNNILYWKVKQNDNILYPKNIGNLNSAEITSSGYCFHYSYTEHPFWNGTLYNGTSIIVSLLKQSKLLHVFIDMVVVNSIIKYKKMNKNMVPKELHRYKCMKNLPLLRNIIIPEFGDSTNVKETILIEFRPMEHLEYLLRNTIIKLPNWNHTVICGNNNYKQIGDICNKICKDISSSIKLIRLTQDNLVPSEYSKLLLRKQFWNLFEGEKLLVYQEDTLLFHNNIDTFLNYDYVGAPWPTNQDDNSYGVGNGGFSLRSKSKLIKCIETVIPENLQLGKSTIDYMKNTNSYVVPEDVYFSKAMIDNKIGKVAPRNIAIEFSQETQLSKNPLGGHNYWLAKTTDEKDNYVKKITSKFQNIKLIDNYYMTTEHRGGWKTIIQYGIDNNIFDQVKDITETDTLLIDCMESFFLFQGKQNIDKINNRKKNSWYGIIHFTDDLPEFLDNISLKNVIINLKEKSHTLDNCKGIIVLSKYGKISLQKYNLGIPIYNLKHPAPKINKTFDVDIFLNNKKHIVIQLGQQYRICSTIYRLQTNKKKLWLPGQKDLNVLKSALMKEQRYIKHKINIHGVMVKYTSTFTEYDNLLLNNIIIIPLWNASANNSVLECIAMNIPVFVTRLPATEEYLGKNYPMFFTLITELEYIINNDYLLHELYKKTYNYMKNMNKNNIQLEYFYSELLKIIT
jgi:hypothetical protein